MRGHFFNYRALGRLLLYGTIAMAIIVAAILMVRRDRHASPAVPSATASLTSDALLQELARCQAIGTAAQSDRACLAAWAENRHRFFGGDK